MQHSIEWKKSKVSHISSGIPSASILVQTLAQRLDDEFHQINQIVLDTLLQITGTKHSDCIDVFISGGFEAVPEITAQPTRAHRPSSAEDHFSRVSPDSLARLLALPPSTLPEIDCAAAVRMCHLLPPKQYQIDLDLQRKSAPTFRSRHLGCRTCNWHSDGCSYMYDLAPPSFVLLFWRLYITLRASHYKRHLSEMNRHGSGSADEAADETAVEAEIEAAMDSATCAANEIISGAADHPQHPDPQSGLFESHVIYTKYHFEDIKFGYLQSTKKIAEKHQKMGIRLNEGDIPFCWLIQVRREYSDGHPLRRILMEQVYESPTTKCKPIGLTAM